MPAARRALRSGTRRATSAPRTEHHQPRGKQRHAMLADDLLGRVPEDRFRTSVEGLNASFEVAGDHTSLGFSGHVGPSIAAMATPCGNSHRPSSSFGRPVQKLLSRLDLGVHDVVVAFYTRDPALAGFLVLPLPTLSLGLDCVLTVAIAARCTVGLVGHSS